MTSLKQTIKSLLPQVIIDIYQNKTRKYGFFGNYTSWDDAKKYCTGYDSDLILELRSKIKILLRFYYTPV